MKKTIESIGILAVAVLLAVPPQACAAGTNEFSATRGLYETPGNWSLGHIPSVDDNLVLIIGGKNVTNSTDVSASVPPTLVVGYANTSNAKLTLNSGAVMQIGNRLVLGAYGPVLNGNYWGSGTLIMDGGSLTVGAGDAIIVGASPSASAGVMTLNSGATLQYNGSSFYVANGGSGAKGTLTINAGTTLNAPDAAFRVANPANNTGLVYINGGLVNVASMVIGLTVYQSGTGGTITQSAGEVNVTGNVTLGANGSSSNNGKYMLTGGTLTIAGANGLSAGATYGGGILTLSNGVMKVDKIGAGKLTTRFSGGTLSANSSGGLSIVLGVELQSGGSGAIFDTAVGPISVAGILSGNGGFTKNGAGTMTLSKANTFTGPTSISAGTLQINTGGLLPSTSVVVQAGSTLAVASGLAANVLSTNAVLALNSSGGNYGQVKIDTSAHQTVYQLVFDGEIQPKGSWGKTGSGATRIDNNRFTGTGILDVLDSGPPRATLVSIR